ncbi:MAG: hemolysin family protein [Salinisphaeraceae bacterium]|nr:hemolysin family protein [Salinisphaeraceae bacterium]
MYKNSLITLLLITCPSLSFAAGLAPTGSIEPDYTQADVILLAVYILLALVFSFLCSVAEATLLSITPSYIAGLKEKHPTRATLLRKLKQDNVDRSLAAILTLNTIAHTVGAIGSGAKATAVFGSAWFGLFSAVMTLLILFASEIVPKTLGAVYWRHLAAPTAQFVRMLIIALYPLILISEQLTKLISGGKKVHPFNRDEFVALAGIGEKSGEIDAHESRIIRNLFRLSSLRARDVMTPRIVIVGFSKNTKIDEAIAAERFGAFSRIPVYGDDFDHVEGFVLKDDMLHASADGFGNEPLSHLSIRELPSVLPEKPLSDLLEFLLDKRLHIALVVDEYGSTQGLVTLEDVVETLLGMEIVDEMDTDTDMRELARKQWRKRAEAMGMPLESLADNLEKLETQAPTQAPTTTDKE